MAKLVFQATGLTVEVPAERAEQMKRHGFVEVKTTQGQGRPITKKNSK